MFIFHFFLIYEKPNIYTMDFIIVLEKLLISIYKKIYFIPYYQLYQLIV